MNKIVAIVTLLLLAACSKPTCVREQPYMQAQPFPPLQAPPGLSVPEPDPNLSIPEVSEGPVGAINPQAGWEDPAFRCLDSPPRLEAKG